VEKAILFLAMASLQRAGKESHEDMPVSLLDPSKSLCSCSFCQEVMEANAELVDFLGAQDELKHIGHQDVHDAEVGVQQRPHIWPIEILECLPYFQVEDLNLRVNERAEETQVQT
jgi:hypothetical protein